jgi:flagellar hook assembly protein FlgD
MDIEKMRQFIREQNALNAIQLDKLTAQIAQLAEVKEVRRQNLAKLLQARTESMLKVSQSLKDLAEQIKSSGASMDVKHAELAEMQKATRENLNALLRTVQENLPRLPKQQSPGDGQH